MDYKDTLLMPKTDFRMRGNLPENERYQREEWEKFDLYNKVREKNKGKKPFVLHDGPPYANGRLHIGHALNVILKDIINRHAYMNGRDTIFIPGWDTHGLPIEQAVTNSGVDRKKISRKEFREACERYAKRQINNQMDTMKKFNSIGDYDNYYATFQKEMVSKQIEVFAKMTEKGLIFRGMKPVFWSPSSESALAEAEIEYQDVKDDSVYTSFKVLKGNEYVNKGDNLVIWTTTPWTLPGNTAIAVGPNFSYSKVEVNNESYIVATDLLDSLKEKFNWENVKKINTFTGEDLNNITYKHVFTKKEYPVVTGDNVTLESGSGLVHTAPSYGDDDYNLSREYNLELIHGVDDLGVLNEESGEFEGLFYKDANKTVIERLDELGSLVYKETITHSYPHDWRTKKPVIYRSTPQWFASIDKIKDELLEEIKNVEWHPTWGEVRLHNMIEGRKDWCISRQRVWGVPLPIFYNEDGSAILDVDVMMHVSKLFKEHGTNIWYEKDAIDLLPEGYTNEKSPNGKFTKEVDTMDVWFDSGSTGTSVLLERGLPYPADIYIEGSDQFRGWFNSSLICNVASNGKAPYKKVISHGFTLDGKGNKMSKSLGNVIDPMDVVNRQGADVLRLWVASIDYREDMPISQEILNQVSESYRKIRNTSRFILGNLSDYDNEKDKVDYENLFPYDKYMLYKLDEFTKKVKENYKKYDYQSTYQELNNFITFDLSTFYLDFSKDILYIEKEDSLRRRSIQTVMYKVLHNFIVLLAPILPYTSEEIYKHLDGKEESVHLLDFPENLNIEVNNKLWDTFFKIKDEVNKKAEELRANKTIGSSLEAKVTLPLKYKKELEVLNDYIHQLLIVSKVTYDGEEIIVSKTDGEKCNRCWNYVDHLNNDICDRCHNIVNN